MFHVTLICSDEDCAVEIDAWAELDEVERLACDGCGCLLQVLAVSEARPAAAAVMHLPRSGPIPTSRAA